MIYLLIRRQDLRIVRTAEVQREPEDELQLFFTTGDPQTAEHLVIKAENIEPAVAHKLVGNAVLEGIEGVPEWRIRVDSADAIQARLSEYARQACDERLLQMAMVYVAVRQARELVVAKQLRSTDWLAARQDMVGRLVDEAARTEPMAKIPAELEAVAGKAIRP